MVGRRIVYKNTLTGVFFYFLTCSLTFEGVFILKSDLLQETASKGRKPTIKEAVVAMFLVIVVILTSINTALVLETALALGALVAAVFGFYLGYGWQDIEKGMLDGIRNGLGACLIVMIIGMVIGTWILGGTIQTLIYYGLKILTPSTFLPAALLLCAITSVLIGTSLGTIATMGIVLLGVAEGLNIPKAIAVGAIVTGAVFGDKVSPMSDSTNMTAAMTGTDLFDHVRSMLYVSGPGLVISLILYTIIGNKYISGSIDIGTLNETLSTLSTNFNISPITLIPPVLVLALTIKKVPAIPALMASFVTSSIFSILTQGASIADILNVAANGYVSETGYKIVDSLLTQGGVNAMMSTVAMIILGTAMGGILEECGVLEVLLESLLKFIKKPRDLILASLISAYIILIATGEMMVTIILSGRTLEPAYREMNIDTSVLSRTLESAATLGCSVLPWGVVSLYIQNIFDIGFEFIPYTFLPFIAPVITIIYAFTGFATWPQNRREVKKVKPNLIN